MFAKVVSSFVVIGKNNKPKVSSNHYNRVKGQIQDGDTLYLAETTLIEIDERTRQSIEEVNGEGFDLLGLSLEDID